ncbi:MAG: hypothetical protein OEY01_09415 [Desulfobulbaceae bacterium]|nr:hypothetical protein [Desulfobulbaceae bacterium]HIJ79222.1 hypothetical protein [Deltaproteobacteria bacterium]
MDIQQIPKTFWHSLSIALLVVSTGLTYVAYKSSTVSIEFANAKINFSSEIASSTIALNTALEEAQKAKTDTETKYAQLQEQHNLLKTQLANFEMKAGTNPALKSGLEQFKILHPEFGTTSTLPPKLTFEKFDLNVARAQKSLERLESLKNQMNQPQ